MAQIVEISDFVGRYAIAQNQLTDYSSFLTAFEQKKLLQQILGFDLGQALIDDLDGNNEPQTARFIDIFSPFTFEFQGKPCSSVGVKEILLQLLYSHIAVDQPVSNHMNGNKTTSTEAAEREKLKLATIYNDAVDNIGTLRFFIIKESSTYPEYECSHYFKYDAAL